MERKYTFLRLPLGLLLAGGIGACQPAQMLVAAGTAGVAGPDPLAVVPAGGPGPVVTAAPTTAPEATPVELKGTVTVAGQPVPNAAITVLDTISGTQLQVVGAHGAVPTTDAQGRFDVLVSGLAPGGVATLRADSASNQLSGLVRGDGRLVGALAARRLLALSFDIQLDEVSTAMVLTYAPFFALLDKLAGVAQATTLTSLLASADKAATTLGDALKTRPDAGARLTAKNPEGSTKNVDVLRQLLRDAHIDAAMEADLAEAARGQSAFAQVLAGLASDDASPIQITLKADGTLQIGDLSISPNDIDLAALATDQGADGSKVLCSALALGTIAVGDTAKFAPTIAIFSGGSGAGMHINISQKPGEHDLSRIVATLPADAADFDFQALHLGTLTTKAAAADGEASAAMGVLDITATARTASTWVGELSFLNGAIKVGRVTVKKTPSLYVVQLDNLRTKTSKDDLQLGVNFGHRTTMVFDPGVFKLQQCATVTVALKGQTSKEVVQASCPLIANEMTVISPTVDADPVVDILSEVGRTSQSLPSNTKFLSSDAPKLRKQIAEALVACCSDVASSSLPPAMLASTLKAVLSGPLQVPPSTLADLKSQLSTLEATTSASTSKSSFLQTDLTSLDQTLLDSLPINSSQ
jgi:hypothetical protein